MDEESPPKSRSRRAQLEALRAKADRDMDELEAHEIARRIPNWPLTDAWRSKIAKLLDGQPQTVRDRVRELVKERWDRLADAQAPRSPAAIEAAQVDLARIEGLASQDIERLKRSAGAAVAFAAKVLGKRR